MRPRWFAYAVGMHELMLFLLQSHSCLKEVHLHQTRQLVSSDCGAVCTMTIKDVNGGINADVMLQVVAGSSGRGIWEHKNLRF